MFVCVCVRTENKLASKRQLYQLASTDLVKVYTKSKCPRCISTGRSFAKCFNLLGKFNNSTVLIGCINAFVWYGMYLWIMYVFLL